MRPLLRPAGAMIVLALLAVGAAVWIFLAIRPPPTPAPLPVEAGDVEIAWLSHATASAVWQRFVQAAGEVPDVHLDSERAFPRLTTAVPEIALKLRGRGHLRIRWYKLTSEWTVAYWTRQLLKRHPPPLAIIGGSNTSVATEQAEQLRDVAADLPEARRPLLLLTQATADHVGFGPQTPDGVPLVKVYDRRTFRFCFTNRQMAETVTKYIWSKTDELRPDSFPIYTAVWEDDSYSRDLTRAFLTSLHPKLSDSGAAAEVSNWALFAGFSGTGGFPFSPLMYENINTGEALDPRSSTIPWSTGGFDRPNLFEAEAARDILDNQLRHQRQRRALLVLSGQSGPSRRLVRALCRLSPIRCRSFVLAAGDTLSFNTIRRDRNVTWPIQDLPCSLVFFCHHNPVGEVRSKPRRPDTGGGSSGTEDIYLFKDIVQALVLANGPATANDLADVLRRLQVIGDELTLNGEGEPLFDADGNRSEGTGEHVVWLKPEFAGGGVNERALPLATLTVVAWQRGPNRTDLWKRRGEPLTLPYVGDSDPGREGE